MTGDLAGRDPAAEGRPLPSASVVICAYTQKRWPMLVDAVRSCLQQTVAPLELIVCIDHNDELLSRCKAEAAGWQSGSPVPITVVPNRFGGRLGSARTTAVQLAQGEVVAFLDDDAVADPDWLENLLVPFSEDGAGAVGGAPVPIFHAPEPRWFPPAFYWVFGCAYEGLPTSRAPLKHLIGANMAARRDALLAIGGFHSDNHDDMDMCHRIAHEFPDRPVLYEPNAIVRHNVTPDRLTWHYFWRRCFFVNRGKVAAFRGMGEAANLDAEASFALRSAYRASKSAWRRAVAGDVFGLVRLLVLLAGLALAAAGNVSGHLWPERTRALGPGGLPVP